jgi:hypothetical protein
MKSKYFFEDKKDVIKKEHEKFKTHSESYELKTDRCNHKGKVKMVGNMLVCECGAAWNGPQIDVLFELLNK